MSHLVDTINDSPASNMKLTDASDLSTLSPSSSDYLLYDGANWTLTNAGLTLSETGVGHRFVALQSIGVGYPTNTYALGTRDFHQIYHYPANVNVLADTGYSLTYNYGNGSGLSSVTGAFVTAGTYLCKHSIVCDSMNTTAESVWRFCVGSFSSGAPTTSNTNFTGPKFYHAPKQGIFNTHPATIITVTQTSFIGLRLVSASSIHLGTPGSFDFYHYSLHYEKIA